MGNDIGNIGCCGGPGRSGLVRDEERFGRMPEPMPVASSDILKHDRINEWSEPGALDDGRGEPWWCGGKCGQGAAQDSNVPGSAFRPAALKSAAYLVADTPDGAMLMSTERGDGGGSMWLGDVDNDPGKALRPIWDPSVRQELRSLEKPSGKRRGGA
mmetsp:Transcript_95734/g.285821  ORF Transcript_95734/g.285821 Transcript_95734/m.285821 type:complete len:157 (-) Transcript_95734:8-478(-)